MGVEVRGLVHVYPGGVRALDGADLSVGDGEVVGLVGRNGSGKTTLARHLNGLLRPTAGLVLVDGEDTEGQSVARLAARVGLCFQDPADQVFSRRVDAEVAFGPRHLGRTEGDVRSAVADALDLTGLAADAERNPYDLGPGQRRLLALASVLAMRTRTLVLDEPTMGLDARETGRVGAIVGRLREEGRAVLVISHDLRFVAEECDRVAVMDGGRVVLAGTPAEVFAETAWPTLRGTRLDAPFAARAGARLGLGATPTDRSLVEALVAKERLSRHRPAT